MKLVFDGSTSYITVDSVVGLNTTTDWTVGAWVQFADFSNSYPVILCAMNATNYIVLELLGTGPIYGANANKISSWFRPAGIGVPAYSASTIPLATDVFAIVRFDITSSCLTISVNVDNGTLCFIQENDVPPMSMSSFMFGFEITGYPDTHFHGSMSGIAIWKRLLLDAEGAQLNQSMDSIDLNDSELLAFYDMTVDCQGTSLMDRSGHQHNATHPLRNVDVSTCCF
jgi:hypothetical protein